MKSSPCRKHRPGFTLIEVLITAGISTAMMAALLSIYLTCVRSWHRTVLVMGTTREVNHCLEQMVYGVGTGLGLRASYSVTNLGSATDWNLFSSNAQGVAWFDFNPARGIVVYSNAAGCRVIGTNLTASSVTVVGNGLNIMLATITKDGRFSASNTMDTFVKIRTASMR